MDNIKERIIFFENLDMKELNIGNIKMLLSNFGFPHNNYPQQTGGKVFRAQVSNEQPFNSIARLSFNPSPANKMGRANLEGESVFYGSNALDVAIIESCQDELRNGKRCFYITIGEWVLQRNITLNIMCHSEAALLVGTDLPIAKEALETIINKEYPDEVMREYFLLKSEFFSKQFSKQEITNSNDYVFSAIYSSALLNNIDKICDGICYPSVGYKLKGYNLVYNKELFINKTFKFISAHFVKVTFNTDIDLYPHIEYLKNCKRIENDDIINWS